MGRVYLLHTAQLLNQSGHQHPHFTLHVDLHEALAFYHTESPALWRHGISHQAMKHNQMLKLWPTSGTQPTWLCFPRKFEMSCAGTHVSSLQGLRSPQYNVGTMDTQFHSICTMNLLCRCYSNFINLGIEAEDNSVIYKVHIAGKLCYRDLHLGLLDSTPTLLATVRFSHGRILEPQVFRAGRDLRGDVVPALWFHRWGNRCLKR